MLTCFCRPHSQICKRQALQDVQAHGVEVPSGIPRRMSDEAVQQNDCLAAFQAMKLDSESLLGAGTAGMHGQLPCV